MATLTNKRCYSCYTHTSYESEGFSGRDHGIVGLYHMQNVFMEI